MYRATLPKAMLLGACAAAALATALGPLPASAQAEAEAEAKPALSIPLVGILGAPAPAPAAAAQGPAVIPLAPGIAAAAGASPQEGGAIVLPGPRVAQAAPEAAPTPAAVAATPPQAPEPEIPLAGLWPLDISRVADGRAQFRGEIDSLEFALFVPPGTPPRELTVSAVSSAFILPGRSVMRVYSGDTLLGEAPLRSITGLEKATFPLPPGAVSAGVNRIRIEIDLAHRLYCGAVPAYDLWTRVDLARSGVVFDPAAMGVGAAAFLAAANVARTASEPLVLKAEVAGGIASAEAREASRQLGRALGGGLTFTAGEQPAAEGAYPAPVVEIIDGGPAGVRFGIDADGAQVLELRAENGRIPELFAAGQTAAVLDEAPVMPLNTPVPINRLGFTTERISEHLWTETVLFRLPSDWLMNVRERAILNLGYAYLPGMPTGAELRVLVNGAVVRIIPLDRGGRLEEAPLEVRFDAGLLQAGRNVLGFETVVPGDPADQPCLTADVDRIEVRDSSTLFVPASPRMHVPGIARWMSGGGDLSIEAAANAVLGEDDDAQSEMYLNLAAALHSIGGADARQAPRRLVVLRPEDLSSAVFGEFGMGRQAMLATLQRPSSPAPASAGIGAAQAQTLTQTETLTQTRTLVDPNAPLTYTVERTGYVDRAVDGAALLGDRAWRALRRLAMPDPVSDLGAWLSDQRAQAILFQLDQAAPDDLHLLLADDARAEDVLAAMGRAAERGVPLEGHVAVLGWDNAWSAWTDDTRLPVLEEELNQRNWRGVVGNFASAQPRVFVGLLVAIALLSVVAANSYLSASRKQR